MTIAPRYPSLYQLNTRLWLRRLSRECGKQITTAEIDDATIDGFAQRGFDWIWLLSVWRTGPAGRAISRSKPEWRAEFGALLPDLDEDDICGSGFAITAYTVSDEIGGDEALAQFRERLARRDIKLMLDFVPNHTAPDHPWAKSNPDYYVQGSEEQIGSAPKNYLRGRDPFWAANPGAWTRPQLSRLARHAATRLRQSSAAEVANRRIDHHCRQMQRRSM
jgi:Alpha amylase, catalytic domain